MSSQSCWHIWLVANNRVCLVLYGARSRPLVFDKMWSIDGEEGVSTKSYVLCQLSLVIAADTFDDFMTLINFQYEIFLEESIFQTFFYEYLMLKSRLCSIRRLSSNI